MKKLIILGYGGTCFDIADAALAMGQFELLGFLDDAPPTSLSPAYPKILGRLQQASQFKDALFINGIGSPNSYHKKRDILDALHIPLTQFATVIHPAAVVSRSAQVQPGTTILSHTSVGSNVRIAEHVVVLQNSVIGHDDQIGDHSIISAGVILSGRVHIGSHCYLGAGSSVRENRRIGDGSLIGLGSSVVQDIPAGEIWVGTPAKKIKSTSLR